MNKVMANFSTLVFGSPLCGILFCVAMRNRHLSVGLLLCSLTKFSEGIQKESVFPKLTWQKDNIRNTRDGIEVFPALRPASPPVLNSRQIIGI